MDFIPYVIYITIPLAWLSLALIVAANRIGRRRAQLAQADREEYYRKLSEQSIKMDQMHRDEEEDVVREINALNEEDNDVDQDEIKQELLTLREKSNNLQRIDREIDEMCQKISENDLNEANDRVDMLRRLGDKIDQLESENSTLNEQIEKHDCPLPNVGRSYDSNLLQYLSEHGDSLTLDFLKKAFTTLLDIKASRPDIDFEKYTMEVKERQPNYISELTNLQVGKRQIEMKLETKRKDYTKEFSSFSERRLEYIMKNCGAQEYLESLKDTNRVHEEYIGMLLEKIDLKKAAFIKLQERFLKAQEDSRKFEEETNNRYQAWKETELRRERAEVKPMINSNQQINAHQSYIMNSSSSVLDNLIPSPIEIPPLDEILGTAVKDYSQESPSMPYNIPMYPSYLPHPPPPVESTFDENLGQRSSTNSIASLRPRNYA